MTYHVLLRGRMVIKLRKIILMRPLQEQNPDMKQELHLQTFISRVALDSSVAVTVMLPDIYFWHIILPISIVH